MRCRPYLPPGSRPAVVGAVRQLRSKARFGAPRQGYMRRLSVWRAIFEPRTGWGLWPRNSIRDGEGSVNLASLDRAGCDGERVSCDAVALGHCFIPVLLSHLQPAIRRQILEMTKSVAEASSAAP